MEKQLAEIGHIPVIILGCGPSSLSAAIQLKRANIPFFMIAEEVGGIIRNANLIENLLGFPNGISGKELTSIMQDFIRNFEIPRAHTNVNRVTSKEDKFWVTTKSDYAFNCEYLIVGTGTLPDILDIPGEKEAANNNLLFYDIYKFTSDEEGLRIGIIGSGDAAYDYALNLSKKSHTIEILQRKSQSKALPLLVHRVREQNNIVVKSNSVAQKITVNDNNVKLDLDTDQGHVTELYDVIFVTIGRSPNISFLSTELTEYFLEGSESKKFDEKLFFIGDVKNQKYRQLAIAMGDGVKAAMQISAMFLKGQNN